MTSTGDDRPGTRISQAVDILQRGGLVALPTETVYGLGADARSSAAVGRIFIAKGRPATNPLIVHVHDTAAARRWARNWPDAAGKLADRFWPGPLTLVLPKNREIVDGATAGLDSVGLRVPNHPLALELLRCFDGPIAAPSANRSNCISPTTASHVRDELGDKVDLILDGGACTVGIESTVLDLAHGAPRILRPGQISAWQIEQVIGPLASDQPVQSGELRESNESHRQLAPGQLPVHYAPQTLTLRFTPDQYGQLKLDEQTGVIVLEAEPFGSSCARIVTLPRDPAAYAQQLYAALRDLDNRHLHRIYIQTPPDEASWAAVRDRIFRASRPC
ncbi:MAG: threonylcarbamoyl-AMP synthase [Phycisphaerales bacterium]|nr:threonylcarbamoyl-AMP synthase [Phycisphaerales bacterium]